MREWLEGNKFWQKKKGKKMNTERKKEKVGIIRMGMWMWSSTIIKYKYGNTQGKEEHKRVGGWHTDKIVKIDFYSCFSMYGEFCCKRNRSLKVIHTVEWRREGFTLCAVLRRICSVGAIPIIHGMGCIRNRIDIPIMYTHLQNLKGKKRLKRITTITVCSEAIWSSL